MSSASIRRVPLPVCYGGIETSSLCYPIASGK